MTPDKLGIEDFRERVSSFAWGATRITSVHWHHTYQPDHAVFRARGGLRCVQDMYRFHTVTRGWRHMGQHVTIDPEGFIWTGRPWDWAPASATGHNGTDAAHPFMFEMIGDFRKGKDSLTGAQLDAACLVTASIQMRFGLPASEFMFHKEMQATECPGDLDKHKINHQIGHMRHALHDGLLTPDETYAPLRADPMAPLTGVVKRVTEWFR